MDNLQIAQNVGVQIARNPLILPSKVNIEGLFPRIEHWRNGKLHDVYAMANGVTTAGKIYLLGGAFNAVTQITAWYFGLIDNSGFSALSAADTMASHSGWNEFTTYSQSTRVQWSNVTPTGATITNTSPGQFDLTGSGTLYGIFVNSVSTKSGSTGTLWSTAAFSSTVAVTNGDQLKITYTVNA